jgi:type IV secretion system protein TrbE
MLRIDRLIKPWKEAAALNDHINLYGFWNERTFLTKSGDLGMVLSVRGVDYESLDHRDQEYAVKRLEGALKAFGPGFHVYQYLIKSNGPEIPFEHYEDPIVEAAIDQRRRFFEAKKHQLYQIDIFYVVLLEGTRVKRGLGPTFAMLFSDPAGAFGEFAAQFSQSRMKSLLRSQIDGSLLRLEQRVEAFNRQLADFVQIVALPRGEQFTFFRRLLNFDAVRIAIVATIGDRVVQDIRVHRLRLARDLGAEFSRHRKALAAQLKYMRVFAGAWP